MIIQKTSLMSGETHMRDIPIKPEDYDAWINATSNDPARHIQNAAPYLSADDREYLISGVTPDEWNSMFGDDE